MRKADEIADYLVQRYEEITGSPFDDSEIKLQKMMYFIQRNHLKLTNSPIFEDEFEGWVNGPVLTSLRFYFDRKIPDVVVTSPNLDFSEKFIIDSVIEEYGKYSPWALRDFTHNEFSWKKSREGMHDTERGCKTIKTEDIKIDAANARIYDPQFDMYIDEFDDYIEEEM